jgi:hypothetical protein
VEERDYKHCEDCALLGDRVECKECAEGEGWPCKVDPAGQHVHPHMMACRDFLPLVR